MDENLQGLGYGLNGSLLSAARRKGSVRNQTLILDVYIVLSEHLLSSKLGIFLLMIDGYGLLCLSNFMDRGMVPRCR